MIKRNPVAVFFLTCFLNILYQWYWLVQTKRNMERLGANIPTSWFILFPIINLYWDWEYAEGVEYITEGAVSRRRAAVIMMIPTILNTILWTLRFVLKTYEITIPMMYFWGSFALHGISFAILQGYFNRTNTRSLLTRLSQPTVLPYENQFPRTIYQEPAIQSQSITKRHPLSVFLLTVCTGGLYVYYWLVQTKGEMVKRGATIPSSWLIILPIASIIWKWEYAKGVEYVSEGKMSRGKAAFLIFLPLFSSILSLGGYVYLILQGYQKEAYLAEFIFIFTEGIVFAVLQNVFNKIESNSFLPSLTQEPIIPT